MRKLLTAASLLLLVAGAAVTTAAPRAAQAVPRDTRAYRTATVHVDNRTRWTIQVFIDNEDRGVVEPYGDIYPRVGTGLTKLYARAEFTDGSVKTWGPRFTDLDDDITWTLQSY